MKASVLLFALLLTPAFAQQTAPAPQSAFGQVKGRVLCQDTGKPGRFASVQLLSQQPAKPELFDPGSIGKNPDLGKLMGKAFLSLLSHQSNLTALTDIDGRFSLDQIPAGTYYVIASLPGYVSPAAGISQKQRVSPDPETLAAIESRAQKIVIEPNTTAKVEVELERGASLSGAITYADGTPAAGVAPVLMVHRDGKWVELAPSTPLPQITDDRGGYRFTGLPAGEYSVKAALPTLQAMLGVGLSSMGVHMAAGDALLVYYGGGFREQDTQAIQLSASDNRDDVNIAFPLQGLHIVSGKVIAKADRHAVNAGTLELEDPDSKAPLRTATLEADGGFQFHYVPSGSYLLKVVSAADIQPNAAGDGQNGLARLLQSKPLRQYGSAELPVTVKDDATGLTLQVPDAPAGACLPHPPLHPAGDDGGSATAIGPANHGAADGCR